MLEVDDPPRRRPAARRARRPCRARWEAAGRSPSAPGSVAVPRPAVCPCSSTHLATASSCVGLGRNPPQRPASPHGHQPAARLVGQEHDRAGVDGGRDVPHGDPGDLLAALRGRQLAAHGVERRRAPLPPPGRFGLKLHAGRQRADHQARQTASPANVKQVLRIADGERPARRHEEEIERGHAQDGRPGSTGRARAAAQRPPRPAGRSSPGWSARSVRRQSSAADARADQHDQHRPEIAEPRAGQTPAAAAAGAAAGCGSPLMT